VRWGLWGVTQLECAARPGCQISVPLNPASRFAHGYDVLYGARDNPQWCTDSSNFRAKYAGLLGKVGLDSQSGWVAFNDDDWVFIHQFDVQPGATYPDGGATVEIWTHGPGIAAGVD